MAASISEDDLATIITQAVYPQWNTKSYRLRIPHQRAARAILDKYKVTKRTDYQERDMNEPSGEEIKAAQEATQPYRAQITGSPALLSLLYDIDLLPEQIRLFVNARRMIAVCELFKLIPPDALQKLIGVEPQRSKPDHQLDDASRHSPQP